MKKKTIVFILITLTLSCPGEKNCQSCQTYEKTYKCSQCENSVYSLITNKCESLPKSSKIQNCKKYSSSPSIKCEICEFGFRKNLEGFCEKCEIENCAICDSKKNICEACFNNLKIFNNKCDSKNKCDLENCEICHKNQESCLKCENDFSLNGNFCEKGIFGCFLLDSRNPEKCALCDFGFFVNEEWTCGDNESNNGVSKFVWILIIGIIIIGFALFFYFYYVKADADESDEAYRSVED